MSSVQRRQLQPLPPPLTLPTMRQPVVFLSLCAAASAWCPQPRPSIAKLRPSRAHQVREVMGEGSFDPAGLGKKVSEQRAKYGAVWKSTSELGYLRNIAETFVTLHGRRAAAPMGTTSRRWRRISTPSSRCSCWDDVASMAWEVQNLISSQVLPRVRAQARPRGHARRVRLPRRGALPPALRRQHRRAVLCGNQNFMARSC